MAWSARRAARVFRKHQRLEAETLCFTSQRRNEVRIGEVASVHRRHHG